MIKYITILSNSQITLDLMGRKKIFKNKQEVHEDIYTKSYPQYFKRIGITKGYNTHLTSPIFIADPIKDFLHKEKNRKEIVVEPLPKEVDIEEISLDFEDDE